MLYNFKNEIISVADPKPMQARREKQTLGIGFPKAVGAAFICQTTKLPMPLILRPPILSTLHVFLILSQFSEVETPPFLLS